MRGDSSLTCKAPRSQLQVEVAIEALLSVFRRQTASAGGQCSVAQAGWLGQGLVLLCLHEIIRAFGRRIVGSARSGSACILSSERPSLSALFTCELASWVLRSRQPSSSCLLDRLLGFVEACYSANGTQPQEPRLCMTCAIDGLKPKPEHL